MNQPQHADFTWLEIGRRIRDWRLARGWSQQQLAEAASLSQSGVVHLEKGDTNPQLGTLRDIANAFGKSLRELMLGSSPELDEASLALQQRMRRIIESNDKDAVSALEWGFWAAELLLERRSSGGGEAQPELTSFDYEPPAAMAARSGVDGSGPSLSPLAVRRKR